MLDRLIDVILQFLKLFQFWTVLYPYQKGVRLRLGRFHAILDPGLHWMIPFGIDQPLVENAVMETMVLAPQALTTMDGTAVSLSTTVTFHIDNIYTFLLEVEGRNDFLRDSAYGPQSEYVMKKTWAELIALDSFSNELTKLVRRKAKKFGVEVESVQVVDFIKCYALRLLQTHPERSAE